MERRGNSIGVIKVQRSTGDGVSNRCYILELPESLSHEIFFRLPIKTIMRSKSVCNTWYKLISKPDFSVCYSRNSSFKALMNFPAVDNPGLVHLIEISEDKVCTPSLINPKLPSRFAEFHSSYLVGLCNGLLCFIDNKGLPTVNVVNPIMGNPLALPAVETRYGFVFSQQYHFGFNSSGNNFKVMRIVHKLGPQLVYSSDYPEDIKIFTIGVDDQWRSLPTDSMGLEAYTPKLSFGGAFHWIPFVSYNADLEAGKLGGVCKPDLKICTFDLNEEASGQFLGPRGLGSHFNRIPFVDYTPLTIYDGRFSLFDFSTVSETSIWTMEKYGDAESWTKVVVLGTWMPTAIGCGYYPITKFQDEEILFATSRNEILSCNMRDKTSSQIGTCVLASGITLYTPNFFLQADKMGT